MHKMIHPKHFNLSHPEHFRDEKNLLKLQKTLQVANKIGVGIGHLFQWGKPISNFIQDLQTFRRDQRTFTRDQRIAGSIRETIRARYTQEEWEEAIKPVHDQLRKNQNQALIAYLLAQPALMEWGVVDADSLFEFFLIDVQMDACMETSRIRQALSSVQLFVQRCFLGLEAKHGVSSEEVDRDRWEWMSHYRVWEANRKVFLYPENWIRPELRDVKSPFFEELESELLQNDVSNETVTSALKKYFIQVDEVANLEVVGQYLEGDQATGTLHVIGRTRNAPYFFYYRYYEYDNQYWYPWEIVDVVIQSTDVENDDSEIVKNGSFVIPVVWENRLFIFFPQFMQKNWTSTKAQQQNTAEIADKKMADSTPIPYWEIIMGWSEYKNGKWTPKIISSQAIYSFALPALPEVSSGTATLLLSYINPEKFIFSSFSNKDSIKIQIYYNGEQLIFFELLSEDSNGNVKYTTKDKKTAPVDSAIYLPQSFRFNGDSITTDDPASDFVPSIFGLPFSFHYINLFGESILPLQEKSNEKILLQIIIQFLEGGLIPQA
jgi:hypothetical protein